ncbi:MAG: FtsL-like putative cell division protein [Leadbetterella sp.]
MNNSARKTTTNTYGGNVKIGNLSTLDSFAKWLNEKLDIEERLSGRTIEYIVWFFSLMLIYIFIQHRYDGMIRAVEKAEIRLQESRASYIAYKSKYLFSSKQSELEKLLLPLGFEQNGQPPLKVTVEK